MIASKRPHRMWLAGAYAAPIGILSGLTGLGGAEFRLPVIAGIFGYPPRTAVPIDLSVSLFTLTTSLIVRSRSLSLTPVVPLLSVIAAFIVGASITSFIGPGIAARLSDERLRRIVLAVMTVLGIFLIYQSVYPLHEAKLLAAFLPVLLAAGLVGGLLVGIVSSTAGVAGGACWALAAGAASSPTTISVTPRAAPPAQPPLRSFIMVPSACSTPGRLMRVRPRARSARSYIDPDPRRMQ